MMKGKGAAGKEIVLDLKRRDGGAGRQLYVENNVGVARQKVLDAVEAGAKMGYGRALFAKDDSETAVSIWQVLEKSTILSLVFSETKHKQEPLWFATATRILPDKAGRFREGSLHH